MATTVSSNTIALRDWSEFPDRRRLAAAFRGKSSWVVRAPSSRPQWYSAVLGNLTGKLIGGDPVGIEAVRDALREGLSRQTFERLKMAMDVSAEELAQVIDVPTRTLARREKFKPDESERILRVASRFQKALETLGEVDAARKWFATPKRALGGKTPLLLCDTEPGAEAVEQLLGRLEHGVFT